MASSSEDQRALHESIKPYHVFINHRGPDTKDNLASVIYHAFSRSGMNVFFDKTEFVAGQEIPATIKEAIFSSSVQIAILSPRYAESHWCLDELLDMQNVPGAKIIPVYYGVSRQDLLNLKRGKGKYADAFVQLGQKMDGRKRKKRHNSDRIKKWMEALHKVCDIPGLELNSKQFNGDQGKLVDAIYTQAMEHLSRVWRKSGDDLLGLDKAEDEFNDFLEPSEMASSSEDQGTLCGSVDAFISGGSDTKKTLASILYHEFSRSGVNVILNEKKFAARRELPSSVPEAISNSLVRIAILSPKYAESHWCLEELRLMQQTHSKIIPVFCDVPPGDLQNLRNGKGTYADAFSRLEVKVHSNKEIYNKKRIKDWKQAMHTMCNTSGLELNSKDFNGDWGKLVHVIYRRVMEHLRRERTKSVDGLLGIDKAVEKFNGFRKVNREQSGKVKIVGIVGTPGSGKTTLAEEFYYRYRKSFDRSSLLVGVRKTSKQNGLPALQSQLLKDLTNDCLAISNVSEGKDILVDRVRRLCHTKSFRFLIVIDDVDREDQLQALLMKDNVLRSDSLVVVTSRNKAVLKLSGISLCYETKPLSPAEAKDLLWRSAFHKPERIEEFDSLVKTALSKCGGFPKLLKCLGENLRLYGNNEKEDWEDVLQMPIADIFKAIWGDLEEDERQIFLDIACVFKKIDKNSAIRAWAGSGWRGGRALQKLEYMCLVHVNNATNFLSMQDYLLHLGQEIADQQLRKASDLPCRLWHRDAARSFNEPPLQEGAKLRGTREASHKRQYERTTEESFKVELLDVSGYFSYHSFSDRLENLVWLRWEKCPETAVLPPKMNNLRVLQLVEVNLETLCAPDLKLPEELREISVIECTGLVQIPKTIRLLNHLEKMTLDCTTSLKSLPPEFCELKALKQLVLKQCDCLISLPVNFGNLTTLQYIDLSYCKKLSSLPRSFRKLTQLITLDLTNCSSLKMQAHLFEKITSIEELIMENCTELKMPTEITLQRSLRNLNLVGAGLTELPDAINNLTNLQQLSIGGPCLKELPPAVMDLPSLMELQLLNWTLPPPRSNGPLSLSKSPQKPSGEENLKMTSYVYRRS